MIKIVSDPEVKKPEDDPQPLVLIPVTAEDVARRSRRVTTSQSFVSPPCCWMKSPLLLKRVLPSGENAREVTDEV